MTTPHEPGPQPPVVPDEDDPLLRTRMESFGEAEEEQRLLAGRYRLDSLLGRGSMGAVWKAKDVVLGRSVAVKEVLLAASLTDEENHVARERALREARSIAALSHPNVVTLYDVVEDDGRPWVVMELVPAKSLAQIIKDDGPLPPAEVARIGLLALDALNSAHEVGIIHRDVKPGNILVPKDGRVKLADFGISRKADDSQLTRTGLMVGSPSYIAPEVARGREATAASDIWGLGATLQCAVEGEPPFDLGDPVATLTAVVGDPPRPAPHAGPLAPVLGRMLDKDPRTRIRTAELRAALKSIADASAGPATSTAPPPGPPTSRSIPAPRPGFEASGQSPRAPRPPAHVRQPTPHGQQPPRSPAPRPAPPSGEALRASAAIGAANAARPPAPPTSVPSPAHQTMSGYPSTGTWQATEVVPQKRKRPVAAIAIAALVVTALIVAGVVVLLNRDGGGTAGGGTSTSQTTSPTTTEPQIQSNEAAVDGTNATGAIKVGDTFYPYSLTLPEGWEVFKADDGRTEYIKSGTGETTASVIKVTVVAEPLTASDVAAQIDAQRSEQGSPAQLPGYHEIEYKVAQSGNVLWTYLNLNQGTQRRGHLWATEIDGIVWKVITAGPAAAGVETADVANTVIASFQA